MKTINLQEFKQEKEKTLADFSRLNDAEYQVWKAFDAVLNAGKHLHSLIGHMTEQRLEPENRLTFEENRIRQILINRIFEDKKNEERR